MNAFHSFRIQYPRKENIAMNRRMNCSSQLPMAYLLQRQPQAAAVISGSDEYPDIYGLVKFYQLRTGVIVYAEISGLPKGSDSCSGMIFGFHIHAGTSCTGNMNDPFAGAMSHYDRDKCTHPHHAGDLPPLFGNSGKALSIFLTNRFTVNEIIGRTVIIHDNADDLMTQPSGNSGNKIACGVITAPAR